MNIWCENHNWSEWQSESYVGTQGSETKFARYCFDCHKKEYKS